MASKYWIKLYHEILHDPKMGTMSDKLWRRTLELFLLAGEFDQEGVLPTVDEIIWTLRISPEECNETLHELQRLGVAHCNDDEKWIITHFAERQAANTSTERSRAHRERKRQEKHLKPFRDAEKAPENVQRNVAPDTDTDTDINTSPNGEAANAAPIEKSKRQRPPVIPAAQVHVEVTGKYLLSNAQAKEVDKMVGRAPPALEKWRETVKVWVMRGNKPTNIDGQLDWFINGIPVHKNGAHNATYQRNSQQPTGQRLKQRETFDPKTGKLVPVP